MCDVWCESFIHIFYYIELVQEIFTDGEVVRSKAVSSARSLRVMSAHDLLSSCYLTWDASPSNNVQLIIRMPNSIRVNPSQTRFWLHSLLILNIVKLIVRIIQQSSFLFYKFLLSNEKQGEIFSILDSNIRHHFRPLVQGSLIGWLFSWTHHL